MCMVLAKILGRKFRTRIGPRTDCTGDCAILYSASNFICLFTGGVKTVLRSPWRRFRFLRPYVYQAKTEEQCKCP